MIQVMAAIVVTAILAGYSTLLYAIVLKDRADDRRTYETALTAVGEDVGELTQHAHEVTAVVWDHEHRVEQLEEKAGVTPPVPARVDDDGPSTARISRVIDDWHEQLTRPTPHPREGRHRAS